MPANSTQPALLADQIRRAFAGDAWHGDSVLKLLAGVTAAQAAAKPIAGAHSIWEILGHIALWDSIVTRRIQAEVAHPTPQEDFPPVSDASEAAWQAAIEHASRAHQQLVEAVSQFPESRLTEPVPGKSHQPYYDYYFMFSGVVQHEIYHAGQIAMLKKAQLAPR